MPDVPPPYKRNSASKSSVWETEWKASDVQLDSVNQIDEQQPFGPQSRLGRIGTKERHWLAKAILRAIASVLNIIAIGCMIWIATTPNLDDDYYYVDQSIVMWVPVMFALSFIWCMSSIVIPFVLKPSRPLRSGIAVGVDLVLIAAMAMVGWWMLYTISNLTYIRANPSSIREPYYHSGYYGHYYEAANGTVVYHFDRMSMIYNSTNGDYEVPPTPDNFTRTCTPHFASCELQDAYVNQMWHQLPTRIAVTELVDAAAWLNTVLHLVLFIWACVDTHRHRRSRNTERYRRVATQMVLSLEKRGLVTVAGGSGQLPGYLKDTPIK